MLSDFLIVVMWPKWVHKHFQEATKNAFSWEKFYIDFLILLTKYFRLILKTMILTALVNSVIGTEMFTIQKQPPKVFLKFKSKFHKIHMKTPMPVWHGVKVGPGPRDPGPPSKFKSGTPGPTSKFKSGVPGPPAKFKSGTPHLSLMNSFFSEYFFPFFTYLFFCLF